LPLVFLRGEPSSRTSVLLTEHTAGARVLVNVGRKLVDSDGDGYSPFLGGPDCDDSNADVHPGAPEIRGNGIDDNCIGGDRAADDGGGSETAPPPPQSDVAKAYRFDGNVLIVMVDTVRGDRLGVAGYTRRKKSLTPRLDELAARSAYFSRAYSQAPNTARSLPSLLTSRHPSQVAVDEVFKNFSTLVDENITVFEALQSSGFTTTGFSSHYYFVGERNVTQGFGDYDNEGAKSMEASANDLGEPRIVPKVTAKLGELAASKSRFGMFVHLFAPHSTYRTHKEFPLRESGEARFKEAYDYEIAYADMQLGVILDALTEHGLAETTMVVVLSDHGEGFGAHRAGGQPIYFHGRTLYNDQLHVPLLVHLPGTAATVVDQPVALIDVAPTVLTALGIDVPKPFLGRSLLDALLGEELAERPVYAEMLPAPYWDHSAKAMYTGDGRHKLLYRISDKRFELYDVAEDFGERRDLFSKQPDLAEKLQKSMVDWIEVELQQ
jgi:arylsulfatase A-like enzyme